MDAEAIRDVFQGVGPVQIRRMFGGQGIYCDGMMFALEAGGELYLKADGQTEDRFRVLGSRPFAYTDRNGRTATMSYWLIPESALDDPDEAAELARLALTAARRTKVARKGPPPPHLSPVGKGRAQRG
jgi:DNA transformation protein and related proteins